jgi:predicted MFS family arabinose efflux permease
MTENPATYRAVFAVREYRYLFGANVLSLVGDHLAALALGFLVFGLSHSPVLAAASFASTYLAWIIGGPLLSAFADRLPRRAVLVTCDLLRAALFLLILVDGLSAPALVGIAFLAHLCHAPFLSARASVIPEILDGDRYTVANGLDNFVASAGQVLGFGAGGLLLTVLSAREALLLDALTFVASALLIRLGMRHRPAAGSDEPAGTWPDRLAGLTGGVRVVFGDRTLRAYVLLLWLGCAFTFAPEGLIVALTDEYHADSRTGGLLLAAAPVGAAVGTVWLTRLCAPARRRRLILPLALLSCAVLIPAALHPPLPVLVALLAVAGFANCYCVVLNPLFGRAVPDRYRARAFGVAVSGLCAGQGLAMLGAGFLAGFQAPTTVVAAGGLVGTIAVAAVAARWPRSGTPEAVAAPHREVATV